MRLAQNKGCAIQEKSQNGTAHYCFSIAVPFPSGFSLWFGLLFFTFLYFPYRNLIALRLQSFLFQFAFLYRSLIALRLQSFFIALSAAALVWNRVCSQGIHKLFLRTMFSTINISPFSFFSVSGPTLQPAQR